MKHNIIICKLHWKYADMIEIVSLYGLFFSLNSVIAYYNLEQLTTTVPFKIV